MIGLVRPCSWLRSCLVFEIDPSTLARLQLLEDLLHLKCQRAWSSRLLHSTATTQASVSEAPLRFDITLNSAGHPFKHPKSVLSLPVQLHITQLAVISQHFSATMSPAKDTQNATSKQFGDLNLSVIGLGTEYPPYQLDPSCLNTLCARHYPTTPAFVLQSLPKLWKHC